MRVSAGNMYEWVTHVHTHHAGRCPHECAYCYVQDMDYSGKYKGPIRLVEDELNLNYGTGKKIFVEHCIDLFADGVPDENISAVIDHCKGYPRNNYVFQTKNPERMWRWMPYLPKPLTLGITIESDIYYPDLCKATNPQDRAHWATRIRRSMKSAEGDLMFISVEPVLKFRTVDFCDLLKGTQTDYVSIGADSKWHNLPEPNEVEIEYLITWLRDNGIMVYRKDNLIRLTPGYNPKGSRD